MMDIKKENKKLEEGIISEVEKRPLLYDVHTKSFEAAKIREKLWKEIEEELQVPVDILKQKWIVIRDYYRRNKDKDMTPTDPRGKKKGSISLRRMERLKFLDDNFIIRSKPYVKILPKKVMEENSKESEGKEISGTSSNTELNLVPFSVSSPVVLEGTVMTLSDLTKKDVKELQVVKQERTELSDNDSSLDKFFDFVKTAARRLTPMQQLGLKQSISEMLFAYESENIRNDCV